MTHNNHKIAQKGETSQTKWLNKNKWKQNGKKRPATERTKANATRDATQHNAMPNEKNEKKNSRNSLPERGIDDNQPNAYN